jgi:transposase
MAKKKSASSLISELKRKTRRNYNSEEKIRIIIDGIRGDTTVAELCRREGISQGIYYKWSKDFMDTGKRRLTGDTMREANTSEVKGLKDINRSTISSISCDVTCENNVLTFSPNTRISMRVNFEYMLFIIHLFLFAPNGFVYEK